MRKRLYRIIAAVTGGVAISVVLTSQADAWDSAAALKAGDVVCSAQVQATNVRLYGSILNGAGTASIRVASTAGGPESTVWSSTGNNLNFDKHLTAPAPGTFFRGCVAITAATVNTWTKYGLLTTGAVASIGAHTAVLSPGARACGDSGMGPIRLTGTANAPVTWVVNGFDQDYGFVGTVFSVGGQSVNTVFQPSPDLTLLEMCVVNTSQQTITATFDLFQL